MAVRALPGSVSREVACPLQLGLHLEELGAPRRLRLGERLLHLPAYRRVRPLACVERRLRWRPSKLRSRLRGGIAQNCASRSSSAVVELPPAGVPATLGVGAAAGVAAAGVAAAAAVTVGSGENGETGSSSGSSRKAARARR